MKKIVLFVFVLIGAILNAQIPSYVSSNGLVGWWPFNGNANDESGNGNHGTVNGATLTVDRNGENNKAFNFNTSSIEYIVVPFSATINSIQQGVTVSAWILMDGGTPAGTPPRIMELRGAYGGGGDAGLVMLTTDNSNVNRNFELRWFNNFGNSNLTFNPTPISLQSLSWHMITFTADGVNGTAAYFYDGQLMGSNSGAVITSANYNNNPLYFGTEPNTLGRWGGNLDDIGIWNRALTEVEVLALYEGCQLAITSPPQDLNVTTSVGVANFSVASTPLNPSYQWQTNLGLGFQNLSNAGQYSGATTSSLTVSNLSMSNNNQVFRCIVGDGSCSDTTAEATLTIIDDAGIQTNNLTELKLYPNPVQDVLNITGLCGKEFEYEVLSIDGKLLQKGKSPGEINLKELRKGNYVLRVGQQKVSFVKL